MCSLVFPEAGSETTAAPLKKGNAAAMAMRRSDCGG